MDREIVLTVLVLLICGPALHLFGSLPAISARDPSGRRLERACWARLWMPVVPALVLLSVLVGWALQEPESADEAFHPLLLWIAAPFAAVWIRAASRALWALVPASGCTPAATVGILRPRVVVDPGFAAVLDPEALHATCEHEAAHERHRDPLRIWIAQLATDLEWPCPGATARLRAWLRALELARDEEARERGVDGADLAAAVIEAASLRRRGPAPAMASIADHTEALEERVARLLAPLPEVPIEVPGSWRLYALLATLLIAVAISFGDARGEAIVRALPGVIALT